MVVGEESQREESILVASGAGSPKVGALASRLTVTGTNLWLKSAPEV